MNDTDAVKRIRDIIPPMMTDWHVPGAAVSIVKDGEIIMSEGFGLRDIEKGLPVTPDTLMAIGSCSKAFTATSAAQLVDDGLLQWDTPVREYLPDFHMYDPVADQRITPRDLLCHRCGLPGHDFLWYNTRQVSRKELVRRIRYLPPTKDFRAEFQYNNLIFTAAGYLVGEVAHTTWEDFAQQRILDPLGMKSTDFSVDTMQKAADFAQPYELHDGSVKRMAFANIDNLAPAGSINSSVNEMAQWVLLQLNHGKYGIQQIVSPANLAEVHKPQTVMNDPARIRLYGTDLLVYALGWVMHHHRGHKMIWHTGGIDGFVANVSFMPDINAGAVILANLNVTRLGPALLFTLYDRLLGLDDFDWSARFKSVVAEMQQEEQEADQKLTAARIPNTQLSHSLDDYTGAFEHPGYGVITVERNGDGLRQVYNDLPHAMTHYHYDSFDTVFDIEMRHQRFVVSYTTDAQGKIACLLVPFEPLLPPLEFRRWATV